MRHSEGLFVVTAFTYLLLAGSPIDLQAEPGGTVPVIGAEASAFPFGSFNPDAIPTTSRPEARASVFEFANPAISAGLGDPCGGPEPTGNPVGSTASKKRLPPPLPLQVGCGASARATDSNFDVSPVVADLTGATSVAPPGTGGIDPMGHPVGDTGGKKRHPSPLLADSESPAPSTPEPGAWVLLGTGLLGLIAARRRLAAAERRQAL